MVTDGKQIVITVHQIARRSGFISLFGVSCTSSWNVGRHSSISSQSKIGGDLSRCDVPEKWSPTLHIAEQSFPPLTEYHSLPWPWILQSKMLEIQRLYWIDHQRMEALVDDYITHIPLHPYLEGVCCCTKRMEQHKQADEVTIPN